EDKIENSRSEINKLKEIKNNKLALEILELMAIGTSKRLICFRLGINNYKFNVIKLLNLKKI
ncbi:MAG: hypothetical protein J7M03_06955, partial [Candidatus Desulfofervidaceae bacterium]|nr:hypothetical protein [Candidatus Desulfofervidaceae bacterium]